MGRAVGSSNLGMSDWSVRDIDRVIALGLAGKVSKLGTDLFRWLYGADHNALQRLRIELCAVLQARWPDHMSEAYGIALQALREFGGWACTVCEGRGRTTLSNGVVLECQRCHGSGIRRYTDRDRVHGSGTRLPYKRLQPVLEWALDELRRADNATNAALNAALRKG